MTQATRSSAAASSIDQPSQMLGGLTQAQFMRQGGEGADDVGLTKALKQVIQGQHGKIS